MNIEKLLQAFEDWIDAKNSLMKCYKDCDSSPGYHCQRYADKEAEARQSLSALLESMIDARVKAVLEESPRGK